MGQVLPKPISPGADPQGSPRPDDTTRGTGALRMRFTPEDSSPSSPTAGAAPSCLAHGPSRQRDVFAPSKLGQKDGSDASSIDSRSESFVFIPASQPMAGALGRAPQNPVFASPLDAEALKEALQRLPPPLHCDDYRDARSPVPAFLPPIEPDSRDACEPLCEQEEPTGLGLLEHVMGAYARLRGEPSSEACRRGSLIHLGTPHLAPMPTPSIVSSKRRMRGHPAIALAGQDMGEVRSNSWTPCQRTSTVGSHPTRHDDRRHVRSSVVSEKETLQREEMEVSYLLARPCPYAD